MPRFPSIEWAEQFCRLINDSDEYLKAAKGWVWPIIFVVKNIPDSVSPDADSVGLYVDLDNGRCKGVRLVRDLDSEDAPFIIEGDYQNWMDIIVNGVDPVKALVTRRIRLVKGNFSTILRYPKAAITLVKLAQEVGFD